MSGQMSVYSTYTGRIKGYTERGMDGMCTDFVYLMDNDPWFLATMKFVFGISSGRFYGYSFSNLSLETDRKQTPFTCVPLCCLFNICK